MAEESKIQQDFNAPVSGVAGVVHGDQNIHIHPPATPQAEKPAELPNNLNRARTGAAKFVGREEAMAQLHDQLQQQERIAITAVVTGMAGVGKTELALQYALHHKAESTYPGGICWIGVQGEIVGVQLLEFAKSLLGLFPPEDLDLRGQLDYCWSRWQPPGDVLLILDDVHQYEDIKDFLPPQEQRFKVLITTRQHWLAASFEQLRLPVLSESAALALLESLIGASRLQAELEVGKGLCAWLGYLPLGLELVGRFLKRRSNWTLARMQQQLIDKGLQLSALQNPSGDMTAQRGVEAAFEVSWEELNPPARSFNNLALLYNSQGRYEEAEPLYLQALELRQRLLGENHPYTAQSLNNLAKLYDSQRRYEEAEPLFLQALELRKRLLGENHPDVATSLNNLANLYGSQGKCEEAEPLFLQTLELRKRLLGENHPDVATSLNNLANLYGSQGKCEEAEPLFLQTLAIAEKALGENHPTTVKIRENLQMMRQQQHPSS